MIKFKEDQKRLPTTFQSSTDAQGHLGLIKKCDKLWSHCFYGLSLLENRGRDLCAGARASDRTAVHTKQSAVIVPAAHRQECQAFTSAPKIYQLIDINQVLLMNPTGCELHWAIFSYLGVLLEVLTSSRVHSNPQLGCAGGLWESVRRCLRVSCIL